MAQCPGGAGCAAAGARASTWRGRGQINIEERRAGSKGLGLGEFGLKGWSVPAPPLRGASESPAPETKRTHSQGSSKTPASPHFQPGHGLFCQSCHCLPRAPLPTPPSLERGDRCPRPPSPIPSLLTPAVQTPWEDGIVLDWLCCRLGRQPLSDPGGWDLRWMK